MKRKIHKTCCNECHSNYYVQNGYTDEVMEDLKKLNPEQLLNCGGIFHCHMRPKKFCKGVCDFFKVKESDIELGAVVNT
jgi:hypothetical protein